MGNGTDAGQKKGAEVARAVPNIVDVRELWGLRVLQDVPVIPSRTEDFEVFEGSIGEASPEKGHEFDTINVLYKKSVKQDSVKEDVSSLDEIKSDGSYQNNFYRIVDKEGGIRRFLLDLFNTKQEDEKKGGAANAMLRKMLKLAPMHTLTWRVAATNQFSWGDSVRVRNYLYPTEQILVKSHVYVKGRNGRITDVLNLAGDNKDADDSKAFEKWKKMGTGTGQNTADNVIEPGINRVVVLVAATEDGGFEVQEVYVDGDRMVVE